MNETGLDFENASQTVSTNESSNTPKPRANLDDVIDLVIQDAIEYADAPPEKRILPKLVRKSTKSRSKQVNNSLINTGSNNNTHFSTVQNHQMTLNNHTANALMTQTIATNNANNSSSNNPIHPLMQAGFGHPNMQQMAAQLQLAASGKGGIVAGTNTNSSLMQHNMIGGVGVTNNQTQQQQQLTAAMMGFGASQIPNMMMPTYNGSVPITYHQQMASGQYHLPSVTFAQIQQLHQQQQQQQQTQQHQQPTQSHLILGNTPNPSDITTGNNSQLTNMNFPTGSTTNPQQQQTMLPTSYANFPNQAIAVTPYQIPGMMHAFASPTGPTNSTGGQLMSTNPSSANLNGVVSNVTTNSRYLSSTNGSNNNINSATSSNNSNTNNTNTNITLSQNSSNIALSSSVNIGTSTITAASMASLYQQLPQNNAFDFHQQQMLYNQRILQAQQQQQLTLAQQQLTQQQTTNNASTTGILTDYAVPRYGGGYQ